MVIVGVPSKILKVCPYRIFPLFVAIGVFQPIHHAHGFVNPCLIGGIEIEAQRLSDVPIQRVKPVPCEILGIGWHQPYVGIIDVAQLLFEIGAVEFRSERKLGGNIGEVEILNDSEIWVRQPLGILKRSNAFCLGVVAVRQAPPCILLQTFFGVDVPRELFGE